MEGDPICDQNLVGNICIVIGNEGKGLGHAVEKNCDELISIPMLGSINSLNASVACGIILYEVTRQTK